MVWERRDFSSFSEESYSAQSVPGARTECVVLFPKESKVL